MVMLEEIENKDSRRMQPLPWRIEHEDRCTNITSISGKDVLTLWGNDECAKGNVKWCTEDQRRRHAAYVERACNAIPALQTAMENLYRISSMPPLALSIIEEIMDKYYIDDVPPMKGKMR